MTSQLLPGTKSFAKVTIIEDTPTVNNPPIAVAGPDIVANEDIDNVVLDGTGSHDPDVGDTISAYSWIQTAGPSVALSNPNGPTPSFIPPQVVTDVTLTFKLVVKDSSGATSTNEAFTNILVRNVNQPPVARASVLPSTTVDGGVLVTLDSSGSFDPDSLTGGPGIASYQWTQTSGEPLVTLQGANTVKATFVSPTMNRDTVLTFKLVVTDADVSQPLSSTLNYIHVLIRKAPSTPLPPDPPSCLLLADGNRIIIETQDSDTLIGTSVNNIINALGSDDRIMDVQEMM